MQSICYYESTILQSVSTSLLLVTIKGPTQVGQVSPDSAMTPVYLCPLYSIIALLCVTLRASVQDNEEAPLRTPDQQAEIRGHLFHNIATSWFPEAAGFAQKAQADIWAAAKAFPC